MEDNSLHEILENSRITQDVRRLDVLMMKYQNLRSTDNAAANFNPFIMRFHEDVQILFEMINGMIEQIKKLNAELEASKKPKMEIKK